MKRNHGSMEFQQIRYAIAVAEEQNFTRAAQRCRVVQSALSHQIKALERELGVELFARTSRRVEITAAGEAFLVQARASLDAAERAVSHAVAVSGQIRGTLTIGVIPTVTAIDIPGMLQTFRQSHPAVRVRLRGGGSDEFVAAIDDGSMDIAVLGLPETRKVSRVATKLLARQGLVAVVGSEHTLAQRRRLQLNDLAGETFVDFPEGTPGRAQSDLAFSAAGIHREVMFDVMGIDMTLGLIRQNLAVTLLPLAVLPKDPAIVAIPVVDGPHRTEQLAWSKFNPSPAARAFLDILDPELTRTDQSRVIGASA